jgi:hypothetical protein
VPGSIVFKSKAGAGQNVCRIGPCGVNRYRKKRNCHGSCSKKNVKQFFLSYKNSAIKILHSSQSLGTELHPNILHPPSDTYNPLQSKSAKPACFNPSGTFSSRCKYQSPYYSLTYSYLILIDMRLKKTHRNVLLLWVPPIISPIFRDQAFHATQPPVFRHPIPVLI